MASNLPKSDSMNPLYDISVKKNSSSAQNSDLENPDDSHVVTDNMRNERQDLSQSHTLRESKSNTSSLGSDNQPELGCPRTDCQEKIIICLDNSCEMEKVSFQTRAGDKYSPMKLIKRLLGIFLHSKSRLNRKHQFALVLLKDSPFWICDFTNDVEKIITLINSCSKAFNSETCDLSSLFEYTYKHAPLPDIKQPETTPPPYIVRTVVIYGRSHCVPTINYTEHRKLLQSSPYFFLDVFYIHEPVSNENQCETIFDRLCELDERGLSYVSEVSRNPTKLCDSMAQLLAHPLQRPLQKDMNNSINVPVKVDNVPNTY